MKAEIGGIVKEQAMDSPLAYVGGKSKLSEKIIEVMPEHNTYCEVFAGGAWVFFRKPIIKTEILNDLDGDLVTFFRVLQNHLEEFLKQFKWLLTSREWFYDWKDQLEGRGLTDIQKAARYYYLQRQCFGGKVKDRSFGVDAEGPPRINLLRMEEELSAVHIRLSKVTIENLDWKKFILRYDRPGTFFYLDPPYYSKPVYKYNFKGIEDYRELAKTLLGIKGKFILSINDHPGIRETFKPFLIRPVELKYSINRDGLTDAKELLISNTKMEKRQLRLFPVDSGKDSNVEKGHC